MNKNESIYQALKTKTLNHPKYKFGIQIPQNAKHARRLDEINRDKEWEEAMEKEVKSVNEHKKFIVFEYH